MAREQLRFSRSRMRSRQHRRLILAAAAALAVIVIAVLALTLGRGKGGRDDAVPAAKPTATPEPTVEATEVAPEGDEAAGTETEAEDSEGGVVPTPTPNLVTDADIAMRRAATRPGPTAEGFSPVFSKADTTEKIIAITVDDCYQGENLEKIVNKALEVGGKLTIFPIGENALREKQAQVLKYAWENGFELENHTFTHNGLYRCSDKEMAEEIYKQQMALSYILGVEYQPHFLRPKGGDARHDQRMQQYAMQLGYYGIAHWSASGRASKKEIAKNLKPGTIYLFHTTDGDLEKLLAFIPWVAEQGYQMVTLNEMFGYPANETSALTTPISGRSVPQPEPYEPVFVPLKKTSYSYYAYLLQKKLISLGYLKGEADGVYGKDCEDAVKKYQKDHKLKATGVADADLQRELIADLLGS